MGGWVGSSYYLTWPPQILKSFRQQQPCWRLTLRTSAVFLCFSSFCFLFVGVCVFCLFAFFGYWLIIIILWFFYFVGFLGLCAFSCNSLRLPIVGYIDSSQATLHQTKKNDSSYNNLQHSSHLFGYTNGNFLESQENTFGFSSCFAGCSSFKFWLLVPGEHMKGNQRKLYTDDISIYQHHNFSA